MNVPRLTVVLLVCVACGDDQREPAAHPEPIAASGEEAVVEDPPPPEPAEAPASASLDGTVELVPRAAIGPVRIGMSRDAIEALGALRPHPRYSAMTLPVTVYYDGSGAASSMEVSVREVDAVRIGSVTIPRDATMESAAALLGNCAEPDIRIGATLQPCPDASVVLAIGSGDPTELWIRTFRDGESF